VDHESQLLFQSRLKEPKSQKHAVMRPECLKRGELCPSTPHIEHPRPILKQQLCSWSSFGAILRRDHHTLRGWWKQGRLEPVGWHKYSSSVSVAVEDTGNSILFFESQLSIQDVNGRQNRCDLWRRIWHWSCDS